MLSKSDANIPFEKKYLTNDTSRLLEKSLQDAENDSIESAESYAVPTAITTAAAPRSLFLHIAGLEALVSSESLENTISSAVNTTTATYIK